MKPEASLLGLFQQHKTLKWQCSICLFVCFVFLNLGQLRCFGRIVFEYGHGQCYSTTPHYFHTIVHSRSATIIAFFIIFLENTFISYTDKYDTSHTEKRAFLVYKISHHSPDIESRMLGECCRSSPICAYKSMTCR